MSYKIVRIFQDESRPDKVVKRGLTLVEAKNHCRDPETSWKTCKGQVGRARTRVTGPWFDGFEEE